MRVLKFLLIAVVLGAFNSTLGHTETLTEKIAVAFEAGEFPGLHSAIVIKNRKVLAENYFSGKDENWGRKIGIIDCTEDSLHDVRSISKSIVGLLYGIALDEGKVPGLDESLMETFPEYKKYASSKRKRIKIRDVLSMKMGVKWNEDIPYTDKKNSEVAMEYAKDRYKFVLSRKMVGTPGEKWTYNGGATALLARLIEKGTGLSVDEYAKAQLFGPLGIKHFEWNRSWDDVPIAASGLRMTMRDLARIGQMIADWGVYEGRRVISKDRLQFLFEPQAHPGHFRFANHWWVAPIGNPPSTIFALGNGGQRLSVNPEAGIVTVVFAGNYNHADYWSTPLKLINGYFVPALLEQTD